MCRTRARFVAWAECKPDKRTSAQRHAVRAWTTYARARAHGRALSCPTDPYANEQAPPCVHFDDYCMPPSRHERACVRAFPGWDGGLTARHSVDSVRRHKVTGAERTSDAASTSGASTCASHRMRQRIPAQCARGGPATPADGYYSMLCGTCTGTVPNS